MALEAPPAPVADVTLADQIRAKLAAAPLTWAEVKKGLPKPPKKRGEPAADFDGLIRAVLDAEAREGRAFRHPSGSKGVDRYWAADEKERVRAAVLTAAAEPMTLAQLKTAGAKAVAKKPDAAFVEAVVRETIGEDRLYEYPAKTAKAGPRFGVTPPPPPVPVLEQAKFRKQVETLFKSVAKLTAAARVSADEVFAALRARLGSAAGPSVGAAPPVTAPQPLDRLPELDDVILKAVSNAGPGSVLSLADLRREMPAEYRGPSFDEAVLRLANAGRVRVYQDSDPAALSPAERAGYVADDHGHVFKTIARRV